MAYVFNYNFILDVLNKLVLETNLLQENYIILGQSIAYKGQKDRGRSEHDKATKKMTKERNEKKIC